jgi:hypothetical protein
MDLMDLMGLEEANSDSDEPKGYCPPTFEVISLDCEISAYAPDGDEELPLF